MDMEESSLTARKRWRGMFSLPEKCFCCCGEGVLYLCPEKDDAVINTDPSPADGKAETGAGEAKPDSEGEIRRWRKKWSSRKPPVCAFCSQHHRHCRRCGSYQYGCRCCGKHVKQEEHDTCRGWGNFPIVAKDNPRWKATPLTLLTIL